MRLRAALALSSMFAAAFLLTGCAGRTALVEQEFDVGPAGAFGQGPAVDVQNAHGKVEVRVDPLADRARVEVSARTSTRLTAEEERSLLDALRVEQTLAQDGGPDTLVVRTDAIGRAEGEVSFDVRVTLPRASGLRVVNRGGDVRVTGVGGAVQVENRDGAVELRTDEPMTSPVALTTTGGSVYYQAPVTSRQRIDMATERGKASLQARHPRVRVTDYSWDGVRILATINGGDAPALLRSDTGRIRAWFIEDPQGLVRIDP